MPRTRRLLWILSALALTALASTGGLLGAPLPARADELPAPEVEREVAPARPVDLVICLDTSGSMSGLINAAREKLWSVVSELATARPMPDLRVALLTYGSTGHDEAGHVVLQSDLTRDLDLISEKLFAMQTNGGEEFVGRVVWHALEHLDWSRSDALRIVFVAGNESADQDSVRPFRDQAKTAVVRGITVNAIYCGGADDGDATGYRELAALGKGRFAHIDHNHGTVAVVTPYDAELTKLSGAINRTYVAFGLQAEEARRRQVAQDENAEASGAPAAADRAAAKAGRLYRNSAWDLVDRMGEEDFDLAAIPVEQLPETMRSMTLDERRAHLEAKKAERAEIQAKIKDLAAKRDAFVKEEMDKRKLDDTRALDRALKEAIREQAAEGGFTFE